MTLCSTVTEVWRLRICLQPGKLLGTKGACIASIRKTSGAGIKLAQDLSDITDSGGRIEGIEEDDRLLTISGLPEAILPAVLCCSTKLLESQVIVTK